MLIKNKKLHHIAIIIGIISLLLIPDTLDLTYLFFNTQKVYWWTQIYSSLGQGDYFSLLAFVFAFICFVVPYFVIRNIEWIYERFRNK